jgi:Zn-dependent metalloprotease
MNNVSHSQPTHLVPTGRGKEHSVRRTRFARATTALAVTAACALSVSSPASATPGRAPAPTPVPAAAAADQLVGSAAAAQSLRLAAGEDLHRTGVVAGTRGLQYVSYARTHAGYPVLGGDVVVTTDATGTVRGTAVAQSVVLKVNTTATVTAAAATAKSKAQLAEVESTKAARLVVLAWVKHPVLAWETVVTGTSTQAWTDSRRSRTSANKPSVLHVYVDARTGAIVDKVDEVREGTGNGYYYGEVALDTTGSGSSYSLTDPVRPGLKCGGQNGAVYTGTDDAWGNGLGTDLETACVDATYGAEQEVDMLAEWFGRNGVKGDGTTPPIRVGLNDVNAYWNGSYVNFGHNSANTRQATPIDVVGHELGHAIFQSTPGGAGSGNENGGINESTGDIFGALTEAYANNPLDPPDYQVGEEVDLVGDGPIRYMYDPSLAGDPNCWSTSIPSTEVHAAAGPLNHWFYLISEGSAPAGKPASPTCDGSAVTGVGIRKAGEIYYNAMLAKTSTWKYANIRTATLTAAKNLYPGSCAEFQALKAAWTAINVVAQAADPTCNVTGNDFSIAATPATGSADAGASVTTTIETAITAGAPQAVALTASGLPSGTTATFEPASVTSGEPSTLTLTTSETTAGGSYPISVTGTGDDVHSATFTLVVVGAPGCTASNATAVDIPDAGAAVTSAISINGCDRNASSGSTAEVHITHTYRGDLVLDLVAPDGTAYRLKSAGSDSADNIDATYTVDLSGEAANGTWLLKVQDVYAIDIGTLRTWTLTL